MCYTARVSSYKKKLANVIFILISDGGLVFFWWLLCIWHSAYFWQRCVHVGNCINAVNSALQKKNCLILVGRWPMVQNGMMLKRVECSVGRFIGNWYISLIIWCEFFVFLYNFLQFCGFEEEYTIQYTYAYKTKKLAVQQ